MKRIFLFLVTNIAIMLVLGIIISVFNLGQVLDEQGVGLDLGALLILSAVIGMTGSFISLAMSKWLAKKTTGAQVIELGPLNATIHQIDECVSVTDLDILSAVYEQLLVNLLA